MVVNAEVIDGDEVEIGQTIQAGPSDSEIFRLRKESVTKAATAMRALLEEHLLALEQSGKPELVDIAREVRTTGVLEEHVISSIKGSVELMKALFRAGLTIKDPDKRMDVETA